MSGALVTLSQTMLKIKSARRTETVVTAAIFAARGGMLSRAEYIGSHKNCIAKVMSAPHRIVWSRETYPSRDRVLYE